MEEPTRLLYIDACMRDESVSRTHRLAERFLAAYRRAHPHAVVEVKKLTALPLACLHGRELEDREQRMAAGETNTQAFSEARDFAQADRIVIAAPFWDLGFPAMLKVYIENICASGVTFSYREDGAHCRAGKLLFITTRGGVFDEGESAWQEMGSRYLQALCAMWGIPEYDCLSAEGLDMEENDPDAIMRDAYARADELAERF